MSLIVIGIGVTLQSWVGILVILVIFGLALGYRIHVEEKFLVSELGDDYIQYMKKTKQLIPFRF
jgi:protein-S-isoprenylcysteine O-methyltransferase Ste14